MTKKRTIYHVVPIDNGWGTKKEGNKKLTAKFNDKLDAIADGRERAKNADLGQLKIHKKNGVLQTEYTYGEDPKNIKG